MTGPLERFAPPTRAWFEASFDGPTPAQREAWTAIAAGEHALVVAPTGSGKTLSAFLWSIDRLTNTPPPVDKKARCRVLYVSPLKALAVDVERNLRAPLAGVQEAARRLGAPHHPVRVGIRSGDTPTADRRRLVTSPPDILITTPESLFLMLTSRARETLRGVETVIIDEVHAVAGTKRGTHLALSLARLDALLDRPAQRIGLSATVRPVDEVARFLGGDQQVTVVAPPATKQWELQVVVPVEDMSALGEVDGPGDGPVPRNSIWPHVEERLADLVARHRSTIVFANSRRLAERLTGRLNEIAAERAGADLPDAVPAELMAQSGQTRAPADGGTPVIARAHHGSVSKEQRALIEAELKSGRLPCVVATSSLELGIDMGAVDLVVQIESPPSVASALQRVGRAGHTVGALSRGVLFPNHRSDLAPTAVAVERMRTGEIEALRVPTNPLDVLAQQIVAATAMDAWHVDDLFAMVRRSAPFTTLPRSAFEATLDLLSGRYPSDEFAELRPRIVWDRHTGELTGRPGSQRLAVTSGGTIPDRGLFGVFLVGEGAGRRVGELDEEMVYESRAGDVFSLGATSWRIEKITHDQVLVTPAPGRPGRLPFWTGDTPGRPAEFGEAVGALLRELEALPRDDAGERLLRSGLDEWAAGNLLDHLAEQQATGGALPTDQTLVVERFHDELGDWRIVVHSPYGAPVHAPWALAINARLRSRYGVEAAAMAADDGIVLRIPDTDQPPPGIEAVLFDPDEIEAEVTTEVGGSALFASRFRECAARALLLPKRDPGKRSPLWQQRQRSGQLLEIAARHPTFPIVLEAVREVLQDVYDLPALTDLLRRLQQRSVRIVEVTTPQPSPFARALLFDYVAQFVYEGDAPIAERRAAALSLDQGLLTELLGRAELRELLDPDVLAEVEAELQMLTADRRAHSAEALTDLLRRLGPMTAEELTARSESDPTPWITELRGSGRIVETTIAGRTHLSTVEDVSRLRDALGVPVPAGVPDSFLESVDDPLGDLVSRFARTHGPFRVPEVATRFGLGPAVVQQVLLQLAGRGRVVAGEFRPTGSGEEWCDVDVLRRLRRRSLAALRDEIEPVDGDVLARFLLTWQQIGKQAGSALSGVDGVLAAVEQLAGCPVPFSTLESLVLPARVRDYSPGLLDELTATGEVVWAGHGQVPGNDGWVSLHLAEQAPLTLPDPEAAALTPLARRLLELFEGGGGYFFRQLVERLREEQESVDDATVVDALWSLVWAGHVGNDTLAPLRAHVGASRPTRSTRRPPRARFGGRVPPPPRTGPLGTAGRWSLLPARESDPTLRAHLRVEGMLERHGVITRGVAVSERMPGGFAAAYKVLSVWEEAGRCRRGYFVAGLGAAQFGSPGAVDQLRAHQRAAPAPAAVTLAATDPANPYGAALPWPAHPSGRRPGRKAGALVVLVDGRLVLYLERGGRTMLTHDDEEETLTAATHSLTETARGAALGTLTVERVDGVPLLGRADTPVRKALEAAGFVTTSRGLRLRA